MDDYIEDITNDPIPSTSTSAVQDVIDKFEETVPQRLEALTASKAEVEAAAAELEAVRRVMRLCALGRRPDSGAGAPAANSSQQ